MTAVRVLRVFTRDGRGGNHLGVVEDPVGLDSSAMQAIAADLGYSETIFLDGTRVRIFTPVAEMPFAGHPIVGAAWVLGEGKDGAAGTMTIQIGEVEYSIADDRAWVSLPQPGVVTTEPESEATRFGLAPAHRGYLVELPLPYLVFEYDDCDVIGAATPDLGAVAASGAQLYIVAPCTDGIRARFFAPALGVDEDPATGSAAVALAAVRVAQGQPHGEHVIHQGEEIGQPCEINVRWNPDSVTLGGAVAEDAARTVGSPS
jgi:trans-2,3-dihydro-3-hydroxyanthranilate isomerase